MPHISEYEVEARFIERLESLGYTFAPLNNYDDVLANFRLELSKLNAAKLIEAKGEASFSDAEFKRVLIHVENKSVYESAKILRDKYVLTLDNGKTVYLEFFSSDINRNIYQVSHQITMDKDHKDDYIVFPSKIDKMINIGIVESPYIYDQTEPEYVHKRKVKWLKHISRKSFTQGALHEVGSALTFFAVKNYPDEFLSALDSSFTKNEKPDDTIGATAEEIKQSTRDFVLKELSHHLKGYDFERFVANLMEAMGYRTEVSAQGGDSGIDIKAYKDELPPRIVAQVKSQDSDIKETTIQSLKGAMMPGDYGVFITLSSFTKNAKKYLDANPIIRGIDGDGLVDLILKYYDKLDEKYQDIIPLEKVYIPVNKPE